MDLPMFKNAKIFLLDFFNISVTQYPAFSLSSSVYLSCKYNAITL